MYQAKTFNLPVLEGISPKQIEVHLKLYAGYVTFLNKLEETLAELMKDSEKNAYALGEVQRRRGFRKFALFGIVRHIVEVGRRR